MERQKAAIASALLAGSVMAGGLAFAISGGALDGRQDHVGQLQPTIAATVPTPAGATAGAAADTTAPAPPTPTATAAAPRSDDDHHEPELGSDGDDD